MLGPEIEGNTGVDLADTGTRRTTVGATLAAARTAAGLELTDVARDTRVPLRHLKAIETDTHDALPALPYALGFVKAFARAVGLDGEAMAAQFRAETRIVPHVPTPASLEPLDERRLPSRGLVVASIVAVIAVIAGLSAWGAGVFDRPAPAPATEIAAAPDAAPATTPETSADQPAATPGPAAATPGTAPAGAAAMPAATPAGPVPTGAVVLTAKEDVWVKIYDRATRKPVKMGIITAGQSYALPADQPDLLLRTGKAGALAITVGGRPVAPLGGLVETVSDVSLSPASLAARPMPAAAPGA